LADRYLLDRELGRGGMATVYLAHDLRHDRSVALKVLRLELSAILGAERFQREIKTAARLDHPHILPVFDSGETAGLLWYTMPYVEGESLRDRLRREVQLPLEEAVRLTREIADALDYAHSRGIIHRDIKPENILLAGGHARVADFGVAKAVEASGGDQLTETGLAVGTPTYMSPEQASAGPVDGRSDIYALGCVLYEMLAGEPPYSGSTPQAIIAKRVLEPVPHVRTLRESVPESLEQAIRRALSRAPADRFDTAAEFARTLSRSSAQPVKALGTARQSRRRTIVVIALIAMLIAIAIWYGPGAIVHLGVPGGADSAGLSSVAVLPFVPLRGDTGGSYLGDGISQEILRALGQVPGLTVAGRASSFRFRSPQVDPRHTARELNVASVVSGTVQRTGSAIRITAELVDGRTGYQLWSGRYDKSFGDLFSLEDEIATAIVSALSPRLAAAAPARLVRRNTPSAGAHDLVLRAHALYQQSDRVSLERAAALYREALRMDSTYAVAWAGLSNVYGHLADAYRAPREVIPVARAAALKAIGYDEGLSDGHQALALVYNAWDWRFADAAREFRRALELDPGSAETRLWYGVHLSVIAMDFVAADREFRRASELDPLNPMIPYYWSGTALGARDFKLALAQAERLKTLSGDDVYYRSNITANIYAAMGRWRHCLTAMGADSVRISGTTSGSQIGAVCMAHLGRRGPARAAIKRLERATREQYVDGVRVAHLYFAIGEPEKGFDWLDRALKDRSSNMPGLRLDKKMPEEARKHPRYHELVERMGLPLTGSPY
jgi:eukaryotic-like serine/threonine-protein kinase